VTKLEELKLPMWMKFLYQCGTCQNVAQVITKIGVTTSHGYSIANKLEELKIVKTNKYGRLRNIKLTAKGKMLYDSSTFIVCFVKKNETSNKSQD